MIKSLVVWLIGRKTYLKARHSVFDRLAFWLNVCSFFISTSYLIYDVILGLYNPVLPLCIVSLGSIAGVLLARMGKIEASKIMVIVLFSIAIFMITSAEDYATGSHLYYITLGLASFTVLGFKQIKTSLLLVAFIFTLYQISSLTDFSIIPKYQLTAEEVKSRFIINSTAFVIMTTGILILYLRILHQQHSIINTKNKLLKETNKELDHFLYCTSHDLRAPLASVQGLLSLAEQSTSAQETEKLHQLMHQQVNKMDDFIKDIINIIRNSRQPIKAEVFNLNQFIEGIFEEYKFSYMSGDVELINEIDEAAFLHADLTRLRTVVGNLCSNAIKYADKNKSSKYVRISYQLNSDQFFLDISDNGIGIAPTYASKIFDMFYRATETSKGTGLGLYIAKETIHNLGGNISLDSRLGEGTNFRISLPKEVFIKDPSKVANNALAIND